MCTSRSSLSCAEKGSGPAHSMRQIALLTAVMLSVVPAVDSAEEWVQHFSRGAATQVATNVIVAAACTSSKGFYDHITLDYSNAGVPLWTNRYLAVTRRNSCF